MQYFRWTRWYGLVLIALATVSLATCSGSDNGTTDGDSGSGDQDGDAGDGDNTQPQTLSWSAPVEVDLEQAGTQLDLAAMPDGNNFAIAYFKNLDCNDNDDCTFEGIGEGGRFQLFNFSFHKGGCSILRFSAFGATPP